MSSIMMEGWRKTHVQIDESYPYHALSLVRAIRKKEIRRRMLTMHALSRKMEKVSLPCTHFPSCAGSSSNMTKDNTL